MDDGVAGVDALSLDRRQRIHPRLRGEHGTSWTTAASALGSPLKSGRELTSGRAGETVTWRCGRQQVHCSCDGCVKG
jgi:hypothetical protein